MLVFVEQCLFFLSKANTCGLFFVVCGKENLEMTLGSKPNSCGLLFCV